MSTEKVAMPFLFRRRALDDAGRPTGPAHYVVKCVRYWSMRFYDQNWMDCPLLGTTADWEVLSPDVDITEREWVFATDDERANQLAALGKMQELWAQMVIPTVDTVRGDA